MILLCKNKKIILKSLNEKDCEKIKKNISLEVIKWLPTIPWPYTIEDAKTYLKKCLEGYKTKKEFNFGIIFEKELVGTISLYKIDFRHKRARLGFLLNKKYWGKNIMFQCVGILLNFAFKKLNLNKVYTGVIKENYRSYRLLKKVGFKEDGLNRKHYNIKGKFYDEIVMSILKNEFEKQ